MQETKLADEDAPVMPFGMAGYDLVHHGEGRWNGVAIAARKGLGVDDIVTNFGDGPGPRQPARRHRARARTTSTRSTRPAWYPRSWAGSGCVAIYAPNGRVVG